MRRYFSTYVLLFVISFASPAGEIDPRNIDFSALRTQSDAKATSMERGTPLPVLVPPECSEACKDYRDRLYAALADEAEASVRLRIGAFEDNGLATWIIFGVVNVLVLTGLVLSALEFKKGRPQNVSSFKFGWKEGFEFSSEIVGIIVFVISLAFFYLYLVHVYPVTETRPDTRVEDVGGTAARR